MALETGESTARITEASTLCCWAFGSIAFDEGRWQLSVGGEVIELERKPLEVLQYLLHHAGEVVTKEELLSTVWEGRIVVEAVLTNAIGKLRKALRDDEQRIILTLPRVGYRLDAKVSRRVVDHVPAASRLSVGDIVPRRSNWRLEEALARGGDGEVWLARHIKTGQTRVFKFSLDGSRLVGLKREVTVGRLLEQALGQRPDLVRVIDWDFEQAPFFVEFEYGGVSLDRWLETIGSTAPLDARLALFIEAANAVAAAHGVGVLHKDLKPANLLVYGAPHDWHLRVADFGSSRVFEAGLLDNLGITRLGFTQTQVLSADTGTPLYMAPEVLGGQSPTIKSDVYALGLTLYQLIIGDFRRPLSAGWENDITDPLLRRDVADAADGDPDKRLDSAAQLAERIRTLSERRQKAALEAAVQQRVAEGEKRLDKVRARRPWVIAAGVLLVAGSIFSSVLWRSSERQRDLARQQAKRADTVLKYLSDDLIRSVALGGKGYEKDPTIKEMIEYASSTVDDNFHGDAATRGSLHAAIGASWNALGDSQQSADQYRKAWQSYVQVYGASNELTLLTQYELARQLAETGSFDESLKQLDAADALAGTRLQERGEVALQAAWNRGRYYDLHAEIAKAAPQLQRAEKLLTKETPDEQAIAGRIRLTLADIYERQGQSQDTINLLHTALSDPDLADENLRNGYRYIMAQALGLQRKYAQAVVFVQEGATSSEKLLGADAQRTLTEYQLLARMQFASGDCTKALETRRRIWKLGLQRYGLNNRITLLTGSSLADNEIKCGDKPSGEALKDEVYASQEKYFPNDPLTNSARFYHARYLQATGKYREAIALLDRVDAAKLGASNSSPGEKFFIEELRGECMLGLGDRVQARIFISDSLDELIKMGENPKAPALVHYSELLKQIGGEQPSMFTHK